MTDMNMQKHTLTSLLLLTTFIIQAQSSVADTASTGKIHEFTVGGEVMARGEYRDGDIQSEEESDDVAKFILERTRLYLNYKQPHIEVQLTPQHSGVWGTSGGGAFAMREAWAKIDGWGAFAQIGRQTLAYDDERVIGTDDWSMTSAYHDALRIGYEGHGHKAHAVFAFNQNNSNMNGGTYYVNGGQVYKSMQMFWYHYDFNPRWGVSALFMNTGMQSLPDEEKNKTLYQQLTGVYVKYNPNFLNLEGSFYYQSGRTEHDVPIDAWMASVEGNYDISNRWRANLGYFHLSGDKNYYVIVPGGLGLVRFTHAHAFNPLFASHHQFYGAMDFFYLAAFYGGYSPGLQDLHVGARYSPIPSITLEAKYHWLGTSIKVKDMGHTLGHEMELTASWRFLKDAVLSAGYSLMGGGKNLKVIKRTEKDTHMHWGWIKLQVSPRFFNIKW